MTPGKVELEKLCLFNALIKDQSCSVKYIYLGGRRRAQGPSWTSDGGAGPDLHLRYALGVFPGRRPRRPASYTERAARAVDWRTLGATTASGDARERQHHNSIRT